MYCTWQLLHDIAYVLYLATEAYFLFQHRFMCVATAGIYREEDKVNQDKTHAEKPPVCSSSFADLSISCEHSSVILLTVSAQLTVTKPFVCDTISA
jgi:hypothetical protein